MVGQPLESKQGLHEMDIPLLFGEADDKGAAFGEIGVGDFSGEGEVEVVGEAGGVGGGIEEVDDVSAEAIFEATAFFEVEGAGGIDFDVV